MGKKEKLVSFFTKVFIAFVFTGSAYFLKAFGFSNIVTTLNMVQGEEIIPAENLLPINNFLNSTLFPVIFTWLLIGFFCYLLYYCLNTTYYYTYNWLVVKATFVNKEEPKEYLIKRRERILIHFLITVSYAVIISLLVFVIFPAANTLQELTILTVPGKDIFFYSFIPPFLFWLGALYLISTLVKKVSEVTKTEEIEEEHFAV